jgi:hypothetical protein
MFSQGLIGLGVFLCCAQTVFQDREIDLHMKRLFKEGETFWVEQVESAKQSFTGLGRSGEMSDFRRLIISITVTRITQNNVRGLLKIEDVKVKTDNGKTKAADDLLLKLLGAEINVELSLDGNLKKVWGEPLNRLALDDENAKIFAQLAKKQGLIDALENPAGVLPERPVRKGFSWNREMTVSAGPVGTLTFVDEITYRGRSDKRAAFSNRIILKTWSPSEEPVRDGLPKALRCDLKGGGNGNLIVDVERGCLSTNALFTWLQGTLIFDVRGVETPVEYRQEISTETRIHYKNPLAK